MKNVVAYIKDSLSSIYPSTEIFSFTKIIVEHITGKRFSPLLMDSPQLLSEQEKKIKEVVERLKAKEPIQYIFGETEFYSLPFYVNENVLIPRPETEELVELILKNCDKTRKIRILDIGTGSGNIAIALAAHLPNAEVEAWDISPEALKIARKNAERNKVSVMFSERDVFIDIPTDKKYDVIVSNPPYILEKEKAAMDKNVLDYEPHLALFVPDDNALIYYSRIADISRNLLVSSGDLYYEINRAEGENTREMLDAFDYKNVEVYKDLSQNDRMTKATYEHKI